MTSLISPPCTPPSIVKNSEFWFSDGSITLLVDNNAFRVHKSILAHHSGLFEDMFSLPQPDQLDESEMFEGQAVVILQDTLDDVVDMLRVLYQPFYFDKLPSNADLGSLVKFISGILRMSTKYSMRVVRHKCISILQARFPSTLAGCERASEAQYSSETVLSAIPLAREANIPGILPWAFYIAAHMPHEKLLKDITLSWRDKALCLAGKERLWESFKTQTHFFLFEVPRITTCQVGCAMRAQQSKSMDWSSAERMRSGPNPLEPYSSWSDLRLCPNCLKHMEVKHYEGRSKLWDQLPTYFGLGTWEDIRREQDA